MALRDTHDQRSTPHEAAPLPPNFLQFSSETDTDDNATALASPLRAVNPSSFAALENTSLASTGVNGSLQDAETGASKETGNGKAGAPEKRIDPHDNKQYTFEELAKFYTGTYTTSQVKAYWEKECKPAKGGGGASQGYKTAH